MASAFQAQAVSAVHPIDAQCCKSSLKLLVIWNELMLLLRFKVNLQFNFLCNFELVVALQLLRFDYLLKLHSPVESI